MKSSQLKYISIKSIEPATGIPVSGHGGTKYVTD